MDITGQIRDDGRERATFRFLDLPGEIRVMIYEAVLLNGLPYLTLEDLRLFYKILLVNSQIRREALERLYKHKSLHCRHMIELYSIPRAPAVLLANITTMKIQQIHVIKVLDTGFLALQDASNDAARSCDDEERVFQLKDFIPALRNLDIEISIRCPTLKHLGQIRALVHDLGNALVDFPTISQQRGIERLAVDLKVYFRKLPVSYCPAVDQLRAANLESLLHRVGIKAAEMMRIHSCRTCLIGLE